MSTSAALERLFELLEEYAPVWYTEEHHNLAVDALAQSAEKFASAAEPVDASRLDLESHRYNARARAPVGRIPAPPPVPASARDHER